MSDSNPLQMAAESYRKQRSISYPFPASVRQYNLLLEIAFMEGAQWQQGWDISKLEQRHAELKAELDDLVAKEATNA